MKDELSETEQKVLATIATGGGIPVPLYLRRRLGLTVDQIKQTQQMLADKGLVSLDRGVYRIAQAGLDRGAEFRRWIEVIIQDDDDSTQSNLTGTRNNIVRDQFNSGRDQFINPIIYMQPQPKSTELTRAQEDALLVISINSNDARNPFKQKQLGLTRGMMSRLLALGMLRSDIPAIISELGWATLEDIKKRRGL